MRVAWFATDGSFDYERTGQDPYTDAPESANIWQRPSARATYVCGSCCETNGAASAGAAIGCKSSEVTRDSGV